MIAETRSVPATCHRLSKSSNRPHPTPSAAAVFIKFTGALVGGQFTWPIFDGFLTKGRVAEAVALRKKASDALAETTRIVELQVRTAWSNLRTARAVLDAQANNVAKGERALELAQIRYNEGDGTQIDVLNAQTALTEAHGSFVDALHNYSVARASLLRATGSDLQWSSRRR
jgi:outer membrane protein